MKTDASFTWSLSESMVCIDPGTVQINVIAGSGLGDSLLTMKACD